MLITNLDTHLKELTETINLIPNSPTRLLSSNLFRSESVRTTFVKMEYTEEKLVLVPDTNRSDPPNVEAYSEESIVRIFPTHHFDVLTPITSDDIQDIRKPGTVDLVQISDVITKQLLRHRRRLDLTIETVMLGAVKGKIIDYTNGKTKIDLFKEFGITEPTFDMKFSNKSTDIGSLIEDFTDLMEDGLYGDTYTGITALCSPEFFQALTSHPSVKDAWKDYEHNIAARENSKGKFAHKGIVFEKYRYNIGKKPLIEAGHAHVFFEGMFEGFVRYNAPSTNINKANKPGEAFHVHISPTPDNLDRGIQIYSEANPLFLCQRPKTLMHLTMS